MRNWVPCRACCTVRGWSGIRSVRGRTARAVADLVVNEAGHQRQKYVANSQVDAALEGLAQYRRLREIVERITQLNLALMKEHGHESR